jgi:potassium channel LctB
MTKIGHVNHQLVNKIEKRGIYLAARSIVMLLFGSILFFPKGLDVALQTPAILGIMLFGTCVMAIILLADLLMTRQKSIESLMYKYFFLTISIILAYGLFYYIDATLFDPPGLESLKGEGHIDLNRDVFYFSGVTYFTIGYGDIIPTGMAKIATITEAFIGNVVNLIVLATAFQRWVSGSVRKRKN